MKNQKTVSDISNSFAMKLLNLVQKEEIYVNDLELMKEISREKRMAVQMVWTMFCSLFIDNYY